MKYPCNIISLHDLHFFHNKMDTELLIKKVKKVIGDNPAFANCDILAIPGDFFDHLVYFNDPATYQVKRFIRYILKMCKKYDVALKIVEGTPGHDHKQCRIFEVENEPIGAKLYYGQTLEIEYDEQLDMHVMYVPDQLGAPLDVYEDTCRLLKQHKLEQVDLILLHGQFNYQFPKEWKIPSHDDELWGQFTKHVILSGHVHKQSVSPNGKVLVAGSFDRMAHGEEAPKGYYNITLHEDGKHDINWIENTEAFTFKTIDIRLLRPEDARVYIDKLMTELPEDGHYRIFVNQEDSFTQSLKELQKCYPLATWKVEVQENRYKQEETENVELVTEVFTPIEITPDNIRQLAEKELRERFADISDEDCEAILELLDKEK